MNELELENLKKDAIRWRYIRQYFNPEKGDFPTCEVPVSPQHADAIIDSLIIRDQFVS